MHRDPTLLLASKSPRRRQLLTQLGFEVKYVDINVDEVVSEGTPVELIPARLALLKSGGYDIPLADDELLVTADTIVSHRDAVLGKPRDINEAREMLRSLSGDVHTVYTGVCLRNSERQTVFTEKSDVYFRELTTEMIDRYVSQGTCLDKAGAYGVQEWIGMVGVKRIDGCFYNVMGLPLSRLYREIVQFLS